MRSTHLSDTVSEVHTCLLQYEEFAFLMWSDYRFLISLIQYGDYKSLPFVFIVIKTKKVGEIYAIKTCGEYLFVCITY